MSEKEPRALRGDEKWLRDGAKKKTETDSSEIYQAMKKILLFWQLSTVTKSKSKTA